MKTKYNDIAVKIFLVVVGVILVGLLIAWSTGVFKDKRNDLNRGTEKINNAISSMAEFDSLVYKGETIKGDTIVDLINEINKKQLDLAVTVITIKNQNSTSNKKGSTYGKQTDSNWKEYDITTRSNENYINPNGNFKGEIVIEENGYISGYIFTQMK